MIKETKEEKTVIEIIREYYCDVCGEPILKPQYAYTRKQCAICGKLICRDCVCHEDYSTGDYNDVYCENCWDTIGSHYRQQIDELENHVEALYDEWYSKCKEEKK
jgi:hypothetical protein